MQFTRLFKSVVLAATLVGPAGCCYGYHHGYYDDPEPEASMCALATCFGLRAVGAPAPVAVAGAMVAGAAVMSAHDGHFHSPYCGCPWRWYDGHRIYWYHGHWEYYDGRVWYQVNGCEGPGEGGGGYQGPGW